MNETDTVTVVKDMLADVFGFNKYTEVNSEFATRGTYCDLAITIDGDLAALIEVKAIGVDLREQHVKQAVDYVAGIKDVDWVLLTNGVRWCVFHVTKSGHVQHDKVLDIDFTALNWKREEDLELLFLWCKEGLQRSALGDFHAQKKALSRFFLAALLTSETTLDVLRRELRRITPDIKITTDQIKNVLLNEVLKRDVVEGDSADIARKVVNKAASKALRVRVAKVTTKVATIETTAEGKSLLPSEPN